MKEKIEKNWKRRSEQWWFEQLPYNLKPDDDKVGELEKLRSRAVFGTLPLPNDIFVVIILGSAWATRRTQENGYAMAKEKMPNASEKEILEAVLRNRIFPRNFAGLKITEKEISEAMQNINSLNDLIEYLLQKEKIERENRFTRDIFGIGKNIANKVDKILEK